MAFLFHSLLFIYGALDVNGMLALMYFCLFSLLHFQNLLSFRAAEEGKKDLLVCWENTEIKTLQFLSCYRWFPKWHSLRAQFCWWKSSKAPSVLHGSRPQPIFKFPVKCSCPLGGDIICCTSVDMQMVIKSTSCCLLFLGTLPIHWQLCWLGSRQWHTLIEKLVWWFFFVVILLFFKKMIKEIKMCILIKGYCCLLPHQQLLIYRNQIVWKAISKGLRSFFFSLPGDADKWEN